MKKEKKEEKKTGPPLKMDTLMNRFVDFVHPVSKQHRTAKVIAVDRGTKTDPAVKVEYRLTKTRKVEKKDGTSYIKRYRSTDIIPLARIRIVYLKADGRGHRRGIPFDEWCLRHPYHKL